MQVDGLPGTSDVTNNATGPQIPQAAHIALPTVLSHEERPSMQVDCNETHTSPLNVTITRIDIASHVGIRHGNGVLHLHLGDSNDCSQYLFRTMMQYAPA